MGLRGSGLGSVGFGTARQGFESKLPPPFALGRRKRPPPTVRRYTGGGCVPKRRSAETELNPTRALSSKQESTKTAFGASVRKTRLQSNVPTPGDPGLSREVLLAPEQWLAGSSESWRWSQKTCLSPGPSVRERFPPLGFVKNVGKRPVSGLETSGSLEPESGCLRKQRGLGLG